jgi:diacylglycerol kinase family enzyme
VSTNKFFSQYKANRKSGNNDGDIILSLFRRLLNPAQVLDLAERPPEAALEWCTLLGEVRATILVAGGDGTVGWVLNTVNKLQLKVGTDCTVNYITYNNNNNFYKIIT